MHRKVKGFMCQIAWDHELGKADQVEIYSTVKQLKDAHPCWKDCGVVEVEVSFVKMICEAKETSP